MKEVYLIYASIPSVLFDSKMHQFVNNHMKYKLHNDYYRGLYAWTTKKKILKKFLEFRDGAKSMYNIIKREFDNEEFQIFKIENSPEELIYRVFSYDKNDDSDESKDNKLNTPSEYKLVCTKEEYEEVYDFGEQYMLDYMSQVVKAEYLVFKDKFKMALDSIGYCDMFNRIYDGLENYDNGDEFYFNRTEMSNFSNSYGLSYYGNPAVDILSNKVLIFMNIYYEMLVGYNPDVEIRLLVYR